VEIRRGQYLSNRYTNLREPADFDLALTAFEQALELDPTLAAAAVEIANLYIFRLEAGEPDALAEVERWSDRALQLDPRSSGGWGVRSYVEGRRHSPDHVARLAAALKAVTYGPADARAHEFLASAINEGDFSSSLAIRVYAETARLDPLYLNPRLAEASILIGMGRAAEANLLVDRVLELQPDMPLALLVRSWALSASGHIEEAAQVADQVDRMVEEGRIEAAANGLSQAVRALDRQDMDTFQVAYAPIRRAATDPDVPHWVKRYWITMVSELARHDQVELTLKLMTAFDDSGLVQSYDGLLLSPVWDSVRDQPQFQQMQERARLRWADTRTVLTAAREQGELPDYLDEALGSLVRQLELAEGASARRR
jgi:tetratricopeptide (TPR) repeat protein